MLDWFLWVLGVVPLAIASYGVWDLYFVKDDLDEEDDVFLENFLNTLDEESDYEIQQRSETRYL